MPRPSAGSSARPPVSPRFGVCCGSSSALVAGRVPSRQRRALHQLAIGADWCQARLRKRTLALDHRCQR
eukprot:10740781-Lingulodinium_polyedra.AAC.1